MLHWRTGSLVVEGAGRAQYRPGDGGLVPFSPEYPLRALATANQLPSPVSSKNPSKPPPPTNHRPFVIVITSKVGQDVQVCLGKASVQKSNWNKYIGVSQGAAT